ncbi:MAG: hypothetical protein U1F43_35420 [Myxococcota bacterium]
MAEPSAKRSIHPSGSWLDLIRQRVELFAALDPGRQIFGSPEHGHRLGGPLGEPELHDLELALGGPEGAEPALPSEYRAFVTRLAAAGAGPYYGLVRAAPPEAEGGDVAPDPSRPFLAEADAPVDAPVAPGTHLLDGTVVVAEQGCGGRSLLVLRGPHRGEVWTDWTREGGAVGPEAPSFGAWYAAWVGRALIDWAQRALPRIALDGPADDHERAALLLVRGPLEQSAEGDADRLRALGYLELAERRWDEAGRAFDAALAAGEEEPAARRALDGARTLHLRGQHAEALALAEAGLAHDDLWYSTDDELHDLQERAHRAMGRHDLALAVLEERAAERFFSFDLHHRLAWTLLDHGDVAGAAQALERAARMPNILGWPEPLARRVTAAFEPIIGALVHAGREAEAEALVAAAARIA